MAACRAAASAGEGARKRQNSTISVAVHKLVGGRSFRRRDCGHSMWHGPNVTSGSCVTATLRPVHHPPAHTLVQAQQRRADAFQRRHPGHPLQQLWPLATCCCRRLLAGRCCRVIQNAQRHVIVQQIADRAAVCCCRCLAGCRCRLSRSRLQTKWRNVNGGMRALSSGGPAQRALLERRLACPLVVPYTAHPPGRSAPRPPAR